MINFQIIVAKFIKEYFCKSCKQLRLCADPDLKKCGSCGSEDLIWGELGELDKEKLKNES